MARERSTRVPVVLPEEAPQGQWMRSMRVSGFTFVMLIVIIMAIVVLAPSLRTLVEQQNQIAELQRAVDEQRRQVSQLESDIARWDDPAYIEAQARDRLVYVYPGDVTYLVIDDGKTLTTDDGAPISTELQSTQVDWVRGLLSSLIAAGTTTQPAEVLQPAPSTTPSPESPTP
jgi:cell division protein FtsB